MAALRERGDLPNIEKQKFVTSGKMFAFGFEFSVLDPCVFEDFPSKLTGSDLIHLIDSGRIIPTEASKAEIQKHLNLEN